LGFDRHDKTMFQEIVTDRLVLRDLRACDAEIMFAYRSDTEVSRYQAWKPASAEELRRFFDDLAGRDPGTSGGWYQVGLALRATGELIGDCGIHSADDPLLAEIGITLAQRFQGHGYAGEALRAMVTYLFGMLRKHRIRASVDPRNERSLRLMERLGFRQEAHTADEVIFMKRADRAVG
jgi:RimJ/RimL family protein N-acetyltransferase